MMLATTLFQVPLCTVNFLRLWIYVIYVYFIASSELHILIDVSSLATGKSGCNHEGAPIPLKMQVVILPKNRVFGTHAHPTIELELTLRGALREVRLVTNGMYFK